MSLHASLNGPVSLSLWLPRIFFWLARLSLARVALSIAL